MSKHTPGPWEYAISGTAWSVTADADPVYIAVVEIPERMSKHAMCEANARLIAASPELLDALQNVVACVDAGDTDSLANAVAEAREAIAKARGE